MRSRPKLKINGKSIATHRYVWEQANGPIPDGWEVHHVDLDRFNNDLSNLQAMPAADHRALHARLNRKHPIERQCDTCGRTYRPHPTKRATSKTCSKECFAELTRRARLAHNPIRRITPEMSTRIRERVTAGERPSDLALEYGVTRPTITYHIQKLGGL